MLLQEYLLQNKMSHKVILTDSSRYAKRELLHCSTEQVPCINVEIMTINMLCAIILENSCIRAGSEFKRLDRYAEASLVMKVMEQLQNENKLSYFKDKRWLSMTTAMKLAEDMSLLWLEAGEEKLQAAAGTLGREHNKLMDLLLIYRLYRGQLVNEKLYDKYAMVTEIIDKVNTEVSFGKNDTYVQALSEYVGGAVQYGIYADTKVTLIERKLLEALGGGNVTVLAKPWVEGMAPDKASYSTDKNQYSQPIGIGAFYTASAKTVESPKLTFLRSYGVNNEIKAVVKDILEKRRNFEDVQVICSHDKGMKYIADYLERIGVPFYMPEGISLRYSCIYSVVQSMFKLKETDYDVKHLKALIENPAIALNKEDISRAALCRFIDRTGIKFGYQCLANIQAKDEKDQERAEQERRKAELIRSFVSDIGKVMNMTEPVNLREMGKVLSDFLYKYAVNQYIREAAVAGDALRAALEYVDYQGNSREIRSVVQKLLEETALKNDSTEHGKVYISTLREASTVFRKHAYVLGMNADNIPGTITESPVLLDIEREKLGLSRFLMSDRENDIIRNVIGTLSGEYESLTMSYIYFDTSKMQEKSPSSLYIRLLKQQGLDISAVPAYGYVDENEERMLEERELYYIKGSRTMSSGSRTIESDTEIAEDSNTTVEYSNTTAESCTVEKPDADDTVKDQEKQVSFTASAIDNFIACHRKYYYKNVVGIPEPEAIEKSASTWLAANEKGTLIHRVLQGYVEKEILPVTEGVQSGNSVQGSLTFNEQAYVQIFDECVEETCQKIAYHSQSAFDMEREEYKKACRDAVYKIYENMQNNIYPVAVEREFECELSINGSEIAFKGIIDRIDYNVTDKSYTIVDYKTGKPESVEKKRIESDNVLFQDVIYAMALEKLEKTSVEKSTFSFVCAGNRQMDTTLDDVAKKLYQEQLSNIMDEILNRNIEACTSINAKKVDCKMCGYSKLCNVKGDTEDESTDNE